MTADLIARLEKATGPDRELDREIARKALGAKAWNDLMDLGREHDPDGLPYFTASVDAALTLLDPASEYEITTLYGIARVAVDLNHNDGPHYGERKDGSVPIALTIAALRARNGGK